uniref:Mytilin 5 n=1 Tax=Mytilus californianus TaxID=6549 RepID=A0A6B9XM90_MYTCA|nr:mytilin 5 [Mytilus californianus]
MKVAIILAIALVVILIVHEADASCASRCKYRCRRRRCRSYVAVRYCCRCLCKCRRCASEHTMKFPENEGSSPSEIFAKKNDNDNTALFKDIQKGETEQGETDM